MGSYYSGGGDTEQQQRQTSLAPSKPKKKPSVALYQAGSEMDNIVTLLHGSDPVRVELTRLENEDRGMFFYLKVFVFLEIFFLFLLYWKN